MWLEGRIVAAIALLASAVSAADRLPGFEDFRVKSIFRGVPAAPKFANREDFLPDADDRYRQSVQLYAEQGPNFAGRYTIARWSCGTYCSSMVVVDAVTGVLLRDAPFGILYTHGNPAAEDHEYAGLSFRKDSRLLIVEGCFDVDSRAQEGQPPDCARRYYRWAAPRFHLLRQISLPVPR